MAVFCCSNCNHTKEVSDSYRGKKAKCPKCGAIALVSDTEASNREINEQASALREESPPEDETETGVFSFIDSVPETQPQTFQTRDSTPVLPSVTDSLAPKSSSVSTTTPKYRSLSYSQGITIIILLSVVAGIQTLSMILSYCLEYSVVSRIVGQPVTIKPVQPVPIKPVQPVPVKPHLTKWEYKIESPSDILFDTEMKSLGNEGWELVFARRATTSGGGVNYEMIFKRPKNRHQ